MGVKMTPLLLECHRVGPSEQIIICLLEIAGVNPWQKNPRSYDDYSLVIENPIARKWCETRKLTLLFVGGGKKRIESPLRMLSNDLLEMIALELKVNND